MKVEHREMDPSTIGVVPVLIGKLGKRLVKQAGLADAADAIETHQRRLVTALAANLAPVEASKQGAQRFPRFFAIRKNLSGLRPPGNAIFLHVTAPR
ncbi:hypothetical protein [Candidatus Accumulibacter phosphatis]|uniref:hypothetical protein n=1 Tax=Candidatus Accumulibacter phosphatis TaxID=327160 RepID=UPI001B7F2782|nr:hypothetical protein [Candidatus Accumulibacter phosphatis]